MQFDDRLATILDLSPTGPRERAVRWRQLVDLVARAGRGATGATLDRALAEIRSARNDIPLDTRAAAARGIAGRPLSPALLEIFAADRLDVAAPLLTVGAPSDSLRRAASPEVRRFLDAMHPPVSAAEPARPVPTIPPPAFAAAPPLVAPEASHAALPPREVIPETPVVERPSEVVPSISEVVERIERLRQVRDAFAGAVQPDATATAQPERAIETVVDSPLPQDTPPERSLPRHDPLPLPADSPMLFRWECGPGGAIGWVDGAPRGALVGRSIARGDESEGVDRDVERAFARRAPFRDASLSLPEAGSVAGDWLISGVPAFAPTDGRFVGYRGIARRADLQAQLGTSGHQVPLDPADLRELVHEIKTPLNAIIGFAEIIDGQYLGPAQSSYRERAAEIVAQAQVLLGAIDDLDLAAKLRGHAAPDPAPVTFAALISDFTDRVRTRASGLGVTIAIDVPALDLLCPLDVELADRLLDRFADAVLASATRDETLRLAVRPASGACLVMISRPRLLEGIPDADLLGASGRKDVDYSLRMVSGLAQLVGGELTMDRGNLTLAMPAAS